MASLSWCIVVLCLICQTLAIKNRILIAGDSWGTEGAFPFLEMLRRHNASLGVVNVARGGTTSDNWAGELLPTLLSAIENNPDLEVMWFTIGGNDARNRLPICALLGGSSDKCVAELQAHCLANIEGKIMPAVWAKNPKLRVVGFGYDLMGFGKLPLCPIEALAIFPHCEDSPVCVNTQFIKIQTVWDMMSKKYPLVDTVNLLGSLQAAAHMPGASVGHPNLAHYSPDDLMQSNCIHPTPTGFGYVFDNFWNLYIKNVKP
eukprot:NODE_1055_length_1081_cov_260.770349_g736_i0.p1 GENE.NODE_1055_length_1081_cov_260.770349_g736_i0~~NODE_1055_length_1081_cov_260.770349_g736_i0.p1  ORF type:complete len:279 (+),score=129.77 NODE_1055_length_1081_cov_260.770349_g736_i0:60-839(+)